MCNLTNTYIHTYIHTYIQCIHTYSTTYIHTYIQHYAPSTHPFTAAFPVDMVTAPFGSVHTEFWPKAVVIAVQLPSGKVDIDGSFSFHPSRTIFKSWDVSCGLKRAYSVLYMAFIPGHWLDPKPDEVGCWLLASWIPDVATVSARRSIHPNLWCPRVIVAAARFIDIIALSVSRSRGVWLTK